MAALSQPTAITVVEMNQYREYKMVHLFAKKGSFVIICNSHLVAPSAASQTAHHATTMQTEH